MKTKLIIFYVLLLSVIIGYADTDKYRIMVNDDPSTTITIGWNQKSGITPVLYYDTVDHGNTDHSLYSNSEAPYKVLSFKGMSNNFVKLTGLLPNTNYYFIIKDSDDTSDRFWFRTAPNDNSRLSFIAGGDSRNNRIPRQNANRLVSKLKPHAVFFGGDMTDNNSSGEWQDWFDDWQLTISSDGRMFPILPARGNHETASSGPVTISNLFDTPNSDSYYAVTFGDDLIRAYTLNTEISVLGNQKTWLESDLSSPSNSAVKWKMAQYHKPIRPHTAWKAENNNQYSAWAQLFYDEGVRLVVECDSHMTKTTWPVMPSSASDNDEGFVTEQTNGTIYTGEGCWGAPLRANDDDKSWTRNSGSFNQFKLIFVDPLKIEMRTINVNNAGSVGEVSDTDPFTLPTGLNVFNPPTGAVVTISNTSDVSCPEVNAPCDDGDPTTDYSYEDGSCNCVGGINTLLVEEYTTKVNASSDDAEENISTGTIDLTSTDLELINDEVGNKNQIVGVRFNTLDIPNSATILRAYIQFIPRNKTGSNGYDYYIDPTNLVVEGELSTNSSTFAASNFDISSRATTTNTVQWSNLKLWGSNGVEDYYARTPNLKSIVDEVRTQSGWVNGGPITFLFSGTGRRVASSYNGGNRPILKIIYLPNRPITNVTIGNQSSCDEMTDTYSQDITLTYNNPPATGNVNVNGQLFPIGSSPQTITLTNLNADGLDVNLSAFFTADSTNIYSIENFFEAPSNCSLNGIPNNAPDDSINLGLLTEATLSGSAENGRGVPGDILYDPALGTNGNYTTQTDWNEYGYAYDENIGRPDVDEGFKWQVNWPNVKYINYITFGGTYSNQPQPNTMWRISYRLDGNWVTLEQGQGGWINSGIFEWGGGTQDPIEADALRVQLYSDGINDLISIHLRARGGQSGRINDTSTTPKATLIQYLSPGNSCGVIVPANSALYCDGEWFYSDGPDEFSGAKNIIIADGTYFIDVDSEIEINDLEILSGASVLIEEGASLTVNGNLINNGSLELESISTKYSSLIVEGTSTGTVSYKRYVNNASGTGATTGSNDLISAPVTGQSFGIFRAANPNIRSGNIGGNLAFLYGPFNPTTGAYINYSPSDDSSTLDPGIGYRTGSTDGSTYTFNGSVQTGNVNVPIAAGGASDWNLIGNPYPSYIDFITFFDIVKSQLDTQSQAIYGYDGDASSGWTVLNNLSTGQLIAPGQGFFVKSKSGGGSISFTPAMRLIGATDDFITGRTPNGSIEGHIKLNINNNALKSYSTSIYFNHNATLDLDPGYDAALFDGTAPSFSIYSNLVENQTGPLLAIQAIGTNDVNNSVIPLGLNASQGEEVTLSISEFTVSNSTKVYLEDRLRNTFTLLNEDNYTFTAASTISGIGRFYLRFEDATLNIDNTNYQNITIYNNTIDKTVVIDGQLQSETNYKLYDINGRILTAGSLETMTQIQSIDISKFNTGIYILELISEPNTKRTHKLIIQ